MNLRQLFLFKGFVFVLFVLGGCNYHFGSGDLALRYTTISVPYAEGDQRGELTTQVIKRLGTMGSFSYVNEGGDLLLKIKLIEVNDENIDFRYDRKKRGEIKNSIVPTETRLTAFAEVQLIEAGSGRILRGPTRISASVEFDHTYYTTRDNVNVFSLGQLSDIYEARDAAMHPLNRCLAERIVDYIINSW